MKQIIAIIAMGSQLLLAADWSSTKVEYLYGTGYKIPFAGPNGEHLTESQSVASFTHASGTFYGGQFYFFDATIAKDKSVSIYGEWSPTLSLGKVLNRNLSMGPLRDYSLSGTLEFAPKNVNRLVGVGFDLNIPKFAFFTFTPYFRDDPSLSGGTWQVTTVWSLPFSFGPANFQFDGFIDWAGKEGADANTSVMNIQAQPALLFDLSSFVGKKEALMVGTEFLYWKNKYGIQGLTESQPQLCIRSVF